MDGLTEEKKSRNIERKKRRRWTGKSNWSVSTVTVLSWAREAPPNSGSRRHRDSTLSIWGGDNKRITDEGLRCGQKRQQSLRSSEVEGKRKAVGSHVARQGNVGKAKKVVGPRDWE